jgi:hypothetical protein
MEPKMHIYLKKEGLPEVITMQNDCTIPEFFCGLQINDYRSTPYVIIETSFEVLKENKLFEEFFLKATSRTFPKYDKLASVDGMVNRRSYGIYHLGNAKAELEAPAESSGKYFLKIQTSKFEGIADMEILQERLWAGSITPHILYDKSQKEQDILQVLREIISHRKLNLIQRFFFALRLTK